MENSSMLNAELDVNFFWLGWFALSVLLFLAEMFSTTFIVIFFSVGALLAGCAALFEFSLTAQVIIFFCSSVALLVLLRRKMPRLFGQDVADKDIFADSAINASAIVTEPVSASTGGRIKYQGTFWNAEAEENIPSGAAVTIISRKASDPNTFIVKKD